MLEIVGGELLVRTPGLMLVPVAFLMRVMSPLVIWPFAFTSQRKLAPLTIGLTAIALRTTVTSPLLTVPPAFTSAVSTRKEKLAEASVAPNALVTEEQVMVRERAFTTLPRGTVIVLPEMVTAPAVALVALALPPVIV